MESETAIILSTIKSGSSWFLYFSDILLSSKILT